MCSSNRERRRSSLDAISSARCFRARRARRRLQNSHIDGEDLHLTQIDCESSSNVHSFRGRGARKGCRGAVSTRGRWADGKLGWEVRRGSSRAHSMLHIRACRWPGSYEITVNLRSLDLGQESIHFCTVISQRWSRPTGHPYGWGITACVIDASQTASPCSQLIAEKCL